MAVINILKIKSISEITQLEFEAHSLDAAWIPSVKNISDNIITGLFFSYFSYNKKSDCG
jgi:hypothetical protein